MPQVLFHQNLFASIGRLAQSEHSACVEFIDTFQQNPAHPGLSLERLSTRSKNLWSGRASRDLRFILFRDADAWLLLYVDHHDAAYRWAERRDVGRHPVTGALQVVEIVETVREVERVVQRTAAAPPLLADRADDYLVSLGIPPDYLPVLREVRSEDDLLVIAERLPADVADRLLRVGAGELVPPPAVISPAAPLTQAAAASSQFYVLADLEGLTAALAGPLDQWLAFLHPSQHALVAFDPRGPVKVTGTAGTGKTVVALHRARHLARAGKRVLLTSYVSTLCDNLQLALSRLMTPAEMKRVTVSTVHRLALRLVNSVEPGTSAVDDQDIDQAIEAAARRLAPDLDRKFLLSEWDAVIAPSAISDWSEYRTTRRTGRGKALSVAERKRVWTVFEAVLADFTARSRLPFAHLARRAEALLESGRLESPVDAVLVDEIQDLRPAALRLLRALAARSPGGLMLFGDPGQRIYAGGFSLGALGIDIRGRSHVLRINYRTTREIRRAADLLLGAEQDDLEGGRESRADAQSLLRGPEPILEGLRDRADEIENAVAWIKVRLQGGLAPDEVACFARTKATVNALAGALEKAGVPAHLLEKGASLRAAVRLGTMHRAKGLEFKAVLILDASEATLPSKPALAESDDPADREAALERERQLLYVAMTRARDLLRVTWNKKPSPFLAPLLTA
jgi:hypothetical protein